MKVLIAEDDPLTRNALAAVFQADGWDCLACADGRNALAAFAAGGFDLVCLDIMMPALSGYDVCREIRRRDARVPVLFVSAKSEEIDTVLGLELGADDFIVKPFGVRELQARVRALLRRSAEPAPPDSGSRAAPAAPFAFGPWQVRPAEARAWLDGRAVDLNARELAMLALMAEKPGQVVGRAEFFRRCWDLDDPPLGRSLDQAVARLRKKLARGAAGPDPIRTVQGLGYRYEP